jgi:hypothetical protein
MPLEVIPCALVRFNCVCTPAKIGEPKGPLDVQLVSELGLIAIATVNARVHGFQIYKADEIVGEPPDVPCSNGSLRL